MKTKTAYIFILFAFTLLVACGHGKSVSTNTSGGIKTLSEETAHNQLLNVNQAGVSGQNQIVYAKTKKQMREEKKQSAAKVIKPRIPDTPKTVTPIIEETVAPVVEKTPEPIVEDATAPVLENAEIEDTLINDTAFNQLSETVVPVTLDTIVTQPAYDPVLIEKYIQPSSKLKKFSVVVGSFLTLEKASEPVLSMKKMGYKPIIVQNERGMYRVIVGTYDDRDDADIDVLGLSFDSISSWVLVK